MCFPHLFRRFDIFRSDWLKIKFLIFKDDRWLNHIEEQGVLPWLIGDLRPLLRGEEGSKFLALATPEEDDITSNTRALFFESLKRPYNFNEKRNEVEFSDIGLTINVDALRGGEVNEVHQPDRLFRENQGNLSTTIVRCWGGRKLEDINSGRIGGLCTGRPQSKSDVERVCSVKISLANGSPYWYSFDAPGCREREFLGICERDEKGCSLGHCGFRRNPSFRGRRS